MEYLEQFPYVIKYKKSKTNIVVDALLRRYTLFAKLRAQILGFDNITKLYAKDVGFSNIYKECLKRSQGGFYMTKGYLFKKGKVCILPKDHIENSYSKRCMKGDLWGTWGR